MKIHNHILILLFILSQSIQCAEISQAANTPCAHHTIQDKVLFYKSAEPDIKRLLLGVDERQKALKDTFFLDRIINQGISKIIFGSSAQQIPLHTIKRSCTDLVGHFISPEAIESGWKDLEDEELKGVSLCSEYFIELADEMIAKVEIHVSSYRPDMIIGRWIFFRTNKDLQNYRTQIVNRGNDIKNTFNEVKKDATEALHKKHIQESYTNNKVACSK